jgi:hypothetical protein
MTTLVGEGTPAETAAVWMLLSSVARMSCEPDGGAASTDAMVAALAASATSTSMDT